MKLRSVVVLLIAIAASLILRAQNVPTPHSIGVDDLFDFHEAQDPQISPDSRIVAYTISSTSLQDDKSETRIYMVPASGGDATPLTTEGVSSNHPRWSPDGKFLAFLSERNQAKMQVYILNLLGGEAQKLTEAAQGVEDFRWSPDGKRLVLILRDPSPEDLEAAASKGKDEGDDKEAAPKKAKSKRPWVIDRLQFKEDTIGYLDRRRTHLYAFDVTSRSMTQVTSGDYDDSEPAWSPDGKLLAFSSNRSKPDPDANYNADIWVVSADNTDKGSTLTQVTTGLGEERSPDWSPDGRWITYTTILDPKLFQYGTKHVAISPAVGGKAKVLTQQFDRMATSPRFSEDGKSIYFLVDDDGTLNVAQVNVADGQVTRPVDGRLMVQSYSVAKEGTIVASLSTMDRPFEIFAIKEGKLTQLSHVNDVWLSKIKLAPGEYVSFKSKDGTTVHGYVYKPVDYVAGKKYPTILRPHGGPVWAYYAEFQDLAQLFAANGYVVLFPNPRGSSGYGENFCKAINADWGNKDFRDDMAMVDYAIGQGYADPDKLGVDGWSYGAISTDFIITQTTRFKAAISGAGAADYRTMWGHDEYQRDYTLELGLPWEHPEVWDHVNFLKRIKDVTTPTMFVGGNVDWNVPILGGEQMYQSLKALGRETLLVVYPDESHEFETPSHIKDLNERFLAWYAHYVKADGTPARPVEKPAADSKPARAGTGARFDERLRIRNFPIAFHRMK
ncbi:MAG: S9 family peptidase [Terriglobales bacterium]|jgi:dipeptidyl aminopeptidase/acylaminoacyl peptidase